MPQSVTPRKRVPWFLWFLAAAIFLVGIGMVWYGWYNGRGLVWILIGGLIVLALIVLVGGTRITLWLAHRLERQILRKPSLASQHLVHTGLQQGGKLVQLGGRALGESVNGARQTLNSLGQEQWRKTGTVTWISAPSRRRDGICPACGHGVRRGAKFCDRCGKPLAHLS